MVPEKVKSESTIHVNAFRLGKLFEEALCPKAHYIVFQQNARNGWKRFNGEEEVSPALH